LRKNFLRRGRKQNFSGSETQDQEKQIVNAVNLLLNYAFEQRTSEIHIEPRRQSGVIRFRIDGILYDVKRIPVEVSAGMTQRLKGMARMNVSEKRKPQDGRAEFIHHDREIYLRVSTIPVVFGEKMMVRLIDPIRLFRPVDDLGFASDELEQYLTLIARPSGLSCLPAQPDAAKPPRSIRR